MSEWWGGKKASLDYWSYYWILSNERNFICKMEGNRSWPPRAVLAEGINVTGRGAHAASEARAALTRSPVWPTPARVFGRRGLWLVARGMWKNQLRELRATSPGAGNMLE